MDPFSFNLELKNNQLVFHITQMLPTPYHYQCIIQASKWNHQWLTLQELFNLLDNKDNLHFCIEDLQLQIIILIGSTTRAIYLPIQQEDKTVHIRILQETINFISNQGRQVEIQRQQHSTDITLKLQQMAQEYSLNRKKFIQIQNKLQPISHQLSIVNDELMKLTRQVFAIDEQIIACKRGFQLQQYRQQTSFQNRQERRRKVYINQLAKYNHPQIAAILAKDNKDVHKIELTDCPFKTMKFVQIFQFLQQIRLPKNLLRKIQGLYSLVNLQILDLSQNVIQKLQGLNNNTQLRQLYLQHNRISKFENIIHLSSLQILALSGNLIEEIPKDIKMLECLIEIRVISNNINILPTQILDLKKLKTFSILGNPCFRESHKAKDTINKLVNNQVLTCCSVF